MVHLYHGDGKGKTTAAIGLAVRMAGTGNRVFIVQFLKGQPSGEARALLSLPGITLLRGKPHGKFTFQMTEEEKKEVCTLHMRQLELAVRAALDENVQMIVLDEALDAVNTGTLAQAALLDAVMRCREHAEIVITGRNPSQEICSCADYITRMEKERHPFDRGQAARKGIEY